MSGPNSPLKVHIRALTGMRVRRGIIAREQCEVCASEYAQAHHPDYSDSILINWLCPKCHADVHRGTLDKEIIAVLKLTASERRLRIGKRIAWALQPVIEVRTVK